MALAERICERADLLGNRELDVEDVDAGFRRLLADRVGHALGLGEVARRQWHARTAARERGRRLGAEASRCAGHDRAPRS